MVVLAFTSTGFAAGYYLGHRDATMTGVIDYLIVKVEEKEGDGFRHQLLEYQTAEADPPVEESALEHG